MKVVLEFNLPDEQAEYDLAMAGSKYHCIIYDILQYIRGLRKYDERREVPIEELAQRVHELAAEFEY